MGTIAVIVSLLVMGSFISAAFVRFFQKKTFQGFVYLIIGIIVMIFFYYAAGKGWIPLPKQ